MQLQLAQQVLELVERMDFADDQLYKFNPPLPVTPAKEDVAALVTSTKSDKADDQEPPSPYAKRKRQHSLWVFLSNPD